MKIETLVALALLLPAVARAGDYAPVPNVKGNSEDTQFMREMLKEMAKQIPNKGDVLAPAYPGALCVSVSKGGKRMLPVLRLVTKDSAEKVTAFYKKALAGWNTGRHMGQLYFWKGTASWSPVKDGFTVPYVTVADAFREMDLQMVPGAKTEISVSWAEAAMGEKKAK